MNNLGSLAKHKQNNLPIKTRITLSQFKLAFGFPKTERTDSLDKTEENKWRYFILVWHKDISWLPWREVARVFKSQSKGSGFDPQCPKSTCRHALTPTFSLMTCIWLHHRWVWMKVPNKYLILEYSTVFSLSSKWTFCSFTINEKVGVRTSCSRTQTSRFKPRSFFRGSHHNH